MRPLPGTIRTADDFAGFASLAIPAKFQQDVY
jgi:hypothetical protein